MSLFLLLHGAHVRAIGRVSETDTARRIRPITPYAAAVLADSPTSYWRMDDTTSVAEDIMGANDGTHVNSPTLGVRGSKGSDSFETAVQYDGVAGGDDTTLPGPAHGAGAGNVTIEFWFLWLSGRGILADAGGGGDPAWRAIYDSGGNDTDFGVQVAPGVQHSFRDNNGTGNLLSLPAYRNRWHHYALVKSGTNLKVYIDATLVLNETESGTVSAPFMPWHVAQVPNVDFAGKVDEIAMYPTALSAARVAAHYAAGTGGWYVAVGRASETDTARAIAHAKQRTLGRVTETDTARAITRQKRKAIGQASETDSAQAIARQKRKTLGQATETDTARAITPARRKALGQPSETDTAQAVSHSKRKAVAQATETDSAQQLRPQEPRAVGRASETDTAQAISHAAARTIARAAETDTAGSVQPQRRYPVGRASETDSAQAVGHAAARTVARATETDTARSVQAQRPYAVARASETDTAGAVTFRKSQSVSRASETDTAGTVRPQRPYAVGRASETDTGRQITPRKAVTVAPASETDTAGAITSTKRKAVARASETDTAQAMTTRKRRQLGQPTETDTAQAMTAAQTGSVAVSVALEIDTAQALTRRKRRQLGQATETDTARALIRGRDLQVISGPTPDEISEVAGFRTATFEWETAADFDEWKVKVVPLAASPHSAGTTIGTANGSANMTGAAGAAATPITSTIDGRDLSAASPGDGDKRIKVFVLSGSEWSP